MAKKTTIKTQMGGGFSSSHAGIHVGSHEAVTKVAVGNGGVRGQMPTQTAGEVTRPSRAGSKQFKFGRNST